jgi:hypothetical protein
MIFESQLHAHGAGDKQTAARIRHEFQELYFPAEAKWRRKALADCRRAFEGMFTAYGSPQMKQITQS